MDNEILHWAQIAAVIKVILGAGVFAFIYITEKKRQPPEDIK